MSTPWLQRSFVRRPVGTAFAVTIVFFLMSGGLRSLFSVLLPDGPHEAQIAAGLQQSLTAILALVLMWQTRWLRRCRVISRPRRLRSVWPLVILPSALVPVFGLGQVDWSKSSQVATSTFDFVSTGLVEELVFRGIVLTGLLIGLAPRPRATFESVLLSSVLFGLPHLHPLIVIFAAVFGLAFAHLTIATNTIWPAVAVHVAFDLLTDLPDSTTESPNNWYVPVALLFVLAGGIVSVVRSKRDASEFTLGG